MGKIEKVICNELLIFFLISKKIYVHARGTTALFNQNLNLINS